MSSNEESKLQLPIETVFVAQTSESSEDPPLEEWSSLVLSIPEENRKRFLHSQGLYDPGSGEICAKYILMSDSAVFRHPYYSYPSVNDPGIEEALLLPEKPIVYPADGQEKYLALCDEMNTCPVKAFHKGLLEDKINLRYYGVNPNGIRAMGLALHLNKTVRSLDLTDNWLSEDGCYHLGQMLVENVYLEELILSGCRMGSEGARKLFYGLPFNKTLIRLDVSKNKIGDAGAEHLSKVNFKGVDLKQINLSGNNITGAGAAHIASSLETHNKFTHFDISWNNLYTPGTYDLLMRLSESRTLQNVNLSWNSLAGVRVGNGLKSLLGAPNLNTLNLNNNRLNGEAIDNISKALFKAKRLATLNMSNNPMAPEEALLLLQKLKMKGVKLQQLLLDNVSVTKAFVEQRRQILNLPFRKNTIITHGNVNRNYKVVGPDPRELVVLRADFLAKRPKKNSIDICLVVQAFIKANPAPMSIKRFVQEMENINCELDTDLIDEIGRLFPGSAPTAKVKTINLVKLAEYMKRKWPDRKLPPTPPPEPEPEPEPAPEPEPVKEDVKKGKKKK